MQDLIRDSEEFQRCVERFRLHAVRCKIDLVNARVVPLWIGLVGEKVASPVVNPETCQVMVAEGDVLTPLNLSMLVLAGVDYVVIQG